MKRMRFCLVFMGVTLAIGAVIGLFVPAMHPWLIAEDHVVETATAAMYAVAGAMALGKAWWGHRHRRMQLAVAVLALVCFLDELSYGERLFELGVPFVAGVKLDAVHDLVEIVASVSLQRLGPWLTLGLLAAMLSVAAWLLVRRRSTLVLLAARSRHEEPIVLTALFICIAVVVILIDLGLVFSYALFALEEMLELNAAVVLGAGSLSLARWR